ncbi:cohesin subunit SA-2 isoform X3 [Cynoglossus semilaevis]|uniref:cohesin subunit SA-2 isoform X3 n=1 Tax=Cynoglossus semilaevis TaxID=244447 RepID=UPI000D62F7D6|nr:cohesin subunit SA-2-like isoform X3 [Cynoglossus semilaevis]
MIAEPTAEAPCRPSGQRNRKDRNSQDEAISSGAVNQSEDESGNENRQKNVRKRKRAHSSENDKSPSPRAGRSSAGRAGGSSSKRRHVEAVTLFEVVTMGRDAMQVVIDDWIEAYVADRDSSLLDLINFFIQSCGCKSVVTAEMCHNKEDSDVMSKMVEDLDEVACLQYKRFLAFPWILTVTWPIDTDSVEYPLIQSGPYGHWFHSGFCDFVSVLVAQCQQSVIFDGYLMNSLISLLAELSDSCIRAFRHTCALAAMKLLSALVGVALSLSVGIENNQKLYQLQKTKPVRQRSKPQLERIKNNTSELQMKRAEIENMMDTIFKGIFIKRYRDVLPEIRSICVEELGVWMKLYNSAFLSDTYLKYMGWMMYDKIPDVRLKCVLGLQALYGDPSLFPKLDLFSSRFKKRMISMTLDKDHEVAAQSLKLLVLIAKTSEDMLTPEDHSYLLQFVYSSQRLLASTAGELLYSTRLLNNTDALRSNSLDEINEEESHRLQTCGRVKALLHFYQESQLHEHVVYLVDSLWDCGGALLKDWTTLTSLLLQDATSHRAGLTLSEQTVLVEILVASVRQASEGPVLAGRSGAKKVISVKEKKIQVDDCTKITEHFLTELPKLLSKFSGHCDAVASLMKIPQFFVPDCPVDDITQVLSSLLTEIQAALDIHSSPAVLEAAARTYLYLCSKETTWSSIVRDKRDSVVQTWVDQLTVLLGESLREDCFSADEMKTGNISSTLKKLSAFHNCHDLQKWDLFQLLFPLLSVRGRRGEEDGAPPEVLLETLRCLCYSMLWSLNTSGETLTSRDKTVAQQQQLCLFCERSLHCLSHPDNRAFQGVCDVLSAHSYQLHVWTPTSFGPLVYTPSPKLQRALSNFVCTHVFAGSDCERQSKVIEHSELERLERLHTRRNLLAAFCKLIVHGVLEMSTAAEVYMHYMKFYNDFGDIIKETMCRTRQMDKIEGSRTLVLCLQQLFVQLKKEQEGSGPARAGVQTFTSIKELARRFSLTFGDKYRECLVMIHRTGIEFVFQGFSPSPETATPPYVSYLTILSEFSSRLLRPDKKAVFSYLQKQTADHVTDFREESWKPLLQYRASLLAAAKGEDAASNVSSDRKHNLPGRSAVSKQKQEGSKSPCGFSPADSRVNKSHRDHLSPSYLLSLQERTAEPLHPSVGRANLEGVIISSSEDQEDETVEVEL